MGYDIYTLKHLESDNKHRAFHYQLKKVDVVDIISDEWNIESDNADVGLPVCDEAEQTLNAESSAYFPVPNQPLWNFEHRPITKEQDPGTCSSTETPPVKRPRHAELSDSELDNIAAARVSKNTEEQTQWGVRVLKGTYKNCMHK